MAFLNVDAVLALSVTVHVWQEHRTEVAQGPIAVFSNAASLESALQVLGSVMLGKLDEADEAGAATYLSSFVAQNRAEGTTQPFRSAP